MFNVIGGVDAARRRFCGSERVPPCSSRDFFDVSFTVDCPPERGGMGGEAQYLPPSWFGFITGLI